MAKDGVRVMAKLKFEACMTVPCLFYQKERDMFVVVHVDDFLCSGEEKDLKWLQQSLEEEFELKAQVVGPGCTATYLGRTITWHDDGISIEGSSKYIDQMAEDWCMQSSSQVSTPGTSDERREGGGR